MPDTPTTMSAADAALLASLERAAEQVVTGRGTVHTSEQITARRGRGRPAGSVQSERLERVTLRLSPEALARWRASGKGWQTRLAQLAAAQAP